MKILVVGAGLSGCAIAKLLQEKNHNVSIIEKNNYIGGLCITKVGKEGFKYEPFGARIFHSCNQNIIDFITHFDDFNGYIHRKGVIINGKLFPFPITLNAIALFEERDKILVELEKRPRRIDTTNFETACISIFGKTLYSYFISNYTSKMWETDPVSLTAEWASRRLELREDDGDELFQNQWQGLPCHGYSFLLKEMIRGIPIRFRTRYFDPDNYDLVVASAPIDEMMDFRYGKLPYRGMKFAYKKDERWENSLYGTINLPQHSKYIRKCNFQILHKQNTAHNYIQYQQPIAAGEHKTPMYPVNTGINNDMFDIYLTAMCREKNICPIGRLGLFKYLDMDKAVEVAFDMVPVLENYLSFSPLERVNEIKKIISNR